MSLTSGAAAVIVATVTDNTGSTWETNVQSYNHVVSSVITPVFSLFTTFIIVPNQRLRL